jgi:uncharacterized membrane protein YfcA
MMLLTITLGLAVGLILALTGAGGGVLAVPLLVFGLREPMADAVPTALVAVGLSALLGAALGLHAGQVRYRAAAYMSAMGVAGAALGAWLGGRIDNALLTLAFALTLAYASTRLLLPRAAADLAAAPGGGRAAPCLLDPQTGRLRWTGPCARALGAAGFAAGVLASLLGVGGGFVLVPALTRASDLAPASVVATSLAVIALVSAASIGVILAGGHFGQRDAALPFAAGALLGMLAGRMLARRLPTRRLQHAFAVLGLFVAAFMAFRSGVSWPAPAGS